MEPITIDIKNGTKAPMMQSPKACRTSYTRMVKFVDDKEHTKPEVYEAEIQSCILR